MGGTEQDLDRMGGRVNFETGMLATALDLTRVGDMSMQSLVSLLVLAFYDEKNDEAPIGFPRASITSDHCLVEGVGALGFTVKAGWGLWYDSSVSLTGAEFGLARHRPIVVPVDDTGNTLAAHDATNPRVDIVCIAPAWADNQSATKAVRNPSTGAVTSSGINLRRQFSYDIQVVTGTPAPSPSEPSVPSGYIRIARAEVPAVTGSVTWRDTRPMIELGDLFRGGSVPEFFHEDFVPQKGSATAAELEVIEQTPNAMEVVVRAGRAVIDGRCRFYRRRPLTVTTAHASLDRIDLVCAERDGTLSITAGTPGASPSPPATPANALPLAQVLVGAAAAAINSGDITDVRKRRPFTGDLIQPASVPVSRMQAKFYKFQLNAGAPSSGTVTCAWTITDLDGNALTADDLPAGGLQVRLEVWLASTRGWASWLQDGSTPMTLPQERIMQLTNLTSCSALNSGATPSGPICAVTCTDTSGSFRWDWTGGSGSRTWNLTASLMNGAGQGDYHGVVIVT